MIVRFLLVFSLSIGALFGIFVFETKNDLEYLSNSILYEINELFIFAEQANATSLKYVETERIPTCNDKNIYRLQDIAIKTPYIRTTNLASNNEIYCTSFFGKSNFIDNKSIYHGGKIALLHGSLLGFDRPLIAYRTDIDNFSSLSGIDTIYIKNILDKKSSMKSMRFYFNVNDIWLNQRGMIEKISPFQKLTLVDKYESSHFPYQIYVGLAYKNELVAFLYEKKNIILMFVFLLMVSIAFQIFRRCNAYLNYK